MKKEKIVKHIKGDIKTFKKEAKEDRELLKDLKHKKHEKKEHKKKDPKKHSKGKAKMKKVMHEFEEGELHSGSKKGPLVTNPKQAVAIAYSEKRRANKRK